MQYSTTEDPVKRKIPGQLAPPFIVMKAMALEDRLKEKDAWDIYYCLRHYPGGIDALVEEFKPHLTQSLVREGLEKMARHFVSVEHSGPMHVANFEELTDKEARDLQIRDAFERVHYFLDRLGIKPR